MMWATVHPFVSARSQFPPCIKAAIICWGSGFGSGLIRSISFQKHSPAFNFRWSLCISLYRFPHSLFFLVLSLSIFFLQVLFYGLFVIVYSWLNPPGYLGDDEPVDLLLVEHGGEVHRVLAPGHVPCNIHSLRYRYFYWFWFSKKFGKVSSSSKEVWTQYTLRPL